MVAGRFAPMRLTDVGAIAAGARRDSVDSAPRSAESDLPTSSAAAVELLCDRFFAS